jgi:hypothetical protein
MLHLQCEEFGVGKNVASAAEHASGGIILNGFAELAGKAV